ncbi:hypothetical protein [Bernardetia sp. MNP-M8]|uniref:hypothetical protein n=1 Tax=Bernardetia sp. MNP-M8 TaxID=3127470 RepID=UPI0030CAB257
MLSQLDSRKYWLVHQILLLPDENLLEKVELFWKNQIKTHSILKPMRKELRIEDLIEEQNYQGFDYQNYTRLSKELNITEPIEQLLADI